MIKVHICKCIIIWPSFFCVISHIVHDEIVIDYSDQDRKMVFAIRDMFEDGYLANLRAGKDFYNLNELKL